MSPPQQPDHWQSHARLRRALPQPVPMWAQVVATRHGVAGAFLAPSPDFLRPDLHSDPPTPHAAGVAMPIDLRLQRRPNVVVGLPAACHPGPSPRRWPLRRWRARRAAARATQHHPPLFFIGLRLCTAPTDRQFTGYSLPLRTPRAAH